MIPMNYLLFSETILFLHQIFVKGLIARMDNWPTLVLGDLFDMLLPMLSIYQEYVRNHHYSLQVLAECKQSSEFAGLLRKLEDKLVVQGRSLEQFLTYPMNQIPRYIVTLHELLAHTPHDHVERKSLEYAKNRLEELSRVSCFVATAPSYSVMFIQAITSYCTNAIENKEYCDDLRSLAFGATRLSVFSADGAFTRLTVLKFNVKGKTT